MSRKPRIHPIGYKVGYRLHKSHKYFKGRRSIREARKYYHSLKGKKTRFIEAQYDLSELVAYTFQTRKVSIAKLLSEPNPIFEVLRRYS